LARAARRMAPDDPERPLPDPEGRRCRGDRRLLSPPRGARAGVEAGRIPRRGAADPDRAGRRRARDGALARRRGLRRLGREPGARGDGDVYHIARGNRTRLYDIHFRKPTPLVPRADIVEIPGRLNWAGEELEPLDADAVRAAARRVRDEGF